jgi:hypothetical protein
MVDQDIDVDRLYDLLAAMVVRAHQGRLGERPSP